MAKKKRDYIEEKKRAYDACVEIVEGRKGKAKKEAIQIAEIRDVSGLDVQQAANAMKWLKRKGLADTIDGKDGWRLIKLHSRDYQKYCWVHGLVMVVEGRGSKKRVYCPICERSSK